MGSRCCGDVAALVRVLLSELIDFVGRLGEDCLLSIKALPIGQLRVRLARQWSAARTVNGKEFSEYQISALQ